MHYLRTAAMVFALAFLLACGGGDGPVVMYTGGGGELGSDVGDQDSVGSDDSTEDAVRPDADVVDDSSGKPDGHTPKQGEFDWPCNGNDECHSGLCVEGAEGPVCTKLCQLGECPDGWYCRGMSVGPDVMSVCIPEGANLCKPCKVDTQCGHGVCLELGDEKFCTRNCSRLDYCPEGYECQEITHNERLTKECIPVLGTCSCGKSNHGEERPCVNRNAVGVCQGFETCDKDLGWVGCTALEPSPEICDGIDNDCNGVADDNPRMPEEECYNETPGVEGRCQGTWSCGGEAGWQCIGPSPAAEECNYRDDNCDGEIDEDFKDSSGRYVTMEHCGQCNNSCLGRIPFAEEIVCAVPDDPEEAPFCQVDKCQSGWVLFNNSCVPPLSSLCMPCSEDSDCGYANDKCVLLEGEGYCGRDCSPEAVQGTECPDGFTCTEIDGVGSQCIPTSGTCQCTVSNNGVKRPCENTNAFGTCIGAQVCDGLLGWGPCSAATPEEEVCDGIDNDCNGYIDDVDIESAPYCANQTGVCEGARQSCGGAAGWLPCNTANYVANSPFYEQMEISCDGLDNDCNGLIDDGPAPLCEKQEGVCAGKTKPCDGAGGSLECDASVYGPDYQEVETLCDGLDNDCNGIIDDPWPNKGKACSKGLGECYATGVIVCTANQLGVECNAPEIEGDDEICDGKDNDCDGKIDEDFPDLGQGCFAGVGECRRFGTMVCNANGDGTVCNAIAGPVADELCDGLDNNCDGDTDEDWPDKGKVCLAGQGQCQASGVYRCKSDGSGLECDAVEGTPTDEVCDYLDNDCNGVVDNGFIDADGRYTADTACANCFTDCTTIWVSAVHHATGVCNATPAVPTCTFVCDEGWVDADQNPDNGCEMFIDVGAVYVSTPYNGGTDNASCGAWDAPCETITYAIGRAGALSRPRVLVSEGIYAENITL
ncbi:MAG TPA: MopE-related protein, partial [Myxococcota bacterium]|nr:MopE-related protein [Myxococcota bacterium]